MDILPFSRSEVLFFFFRQSLLHVQDLSLLNMTKLCDFPDSASFRTAIFSVVGSLTSTESPQFFPHLSFNILVFLLYDGGQHSY